MYFAGPGQGERYYLRMLLMHVRGPKSFEDVRTVDGQLCATFQEAARRRGLLEDDTEVDTALTEAALFQSPLLLRQLFVSILCFQPPADARALWQRHELDLCEDFLHRARQVCSGSARRCPCTRSAWICCRTSTNSPCLYCAPRSPCLYCATFCDVQETGRSDLPLDVEMVADALRHVQELLQEEGKSLEDFGIPAPAAAGAHGARFVARTTAAPQPHGSCLTVIAVPVLHAGGSTSRLLRDQRYDREEQASTTRSMEASLNDDQRAAYEAIMAAVSRAATPQGQAQVRARGGARATAPPRANPCPDFACRCARRTTLFLSTAPAALARRICTRCCSRLCAARAAWPWPRRLLAWRPCSCRAARRRTAASGSRCEDCARTPFASAFAAQLAPAQQDVLQPLLAPLHFTTRLAAATPPPCSPCHPACLQHQQELAGGRAAHGLQPHHLGRGADDTPLGVRGARAHAT